MKHFGRKLICLALAAMMMLSCVGALADAPTITNGEILFAKNGQNTWSSNTEHSLIQPLYEFSLNSTALIKAAIYEQSTGALYTGVMSENQNVGKVTLWWNGVNTNGWHPDAGNSIELLLKIQAENSEGSAIKNIPFSFYSAHNMSSHSEIVIPPMSYDPFGPAYIEIPTPEPEKVYFSHNTVCSFGPQFRCISPEMTDKWYMFTPLDLSQDGKQVYEMISGNTYLIGHVTVTVKGDNVRVEYEYFNDDIWAYDEFFTFFHDYDNVTAEDVEELRNELVYGKTYSIADDLDGDTDVLLFTCNEVTFTKDNPDIVRIFRSDRERKALREQMLERIGKVEVAFD